MLRLFFHYTFACRRQRHRAEKSIQTMLVNIQLSLCEKLGRAWVCLKPDQIPGNLALMIDRCGCTACTAHGFCCRL
jgi:hypothetical protein